MITIRNVVLFWSDMAQALEYNLQALIEDLCDR